MVSGSVENPIADSSVVWTSLSSGKPKYSLQDNPYGRYSQEVPFDTGDYDRVADSHV
jgi:hypothetical protein